jgi:hypothetical protein
MRNLFERILGEIDRARLRSDIETLWRLELPQTFAAYHAAAGRTLEMIKDAGIGNAEMIQSPADGRTVYQDKRTPLAWDASLGRLTVTKSKIPFSEPVIADYKRHPFHLIKGSVSTARGGQRARIISQDQFESGCDARGALVLCRLRVWPGGKILPKALDRGALGLISDYVKSRGKLPDAIPWINASTEGSHWHVQCEDRPFVSFAVSPRAGDLLRRALKAGPVEALAECDGRRYEGTIPCVTALIPGRQKRELWLMAHLYEPLSDDNATGVAGAVELARIIKRLTETGALPPLEFSLRLVFGAEHYGFAAFADRMGGYPGDKVIGAVNMDSLPSGNPGQKLHLYFAPPGTPFFGNSVLEMALEDLRNSDIIRPERVFGFGQYGDDTFLSDKTTGVPTVWPLGTKKMLWHNSALTMETVDIGIFSRICAFIGAWAARAITLGKDNMTETVRRAGALALKHLNEEKTLTDDSERIKWRLQIERERLEDFRKIADCPEIARQIRALEAGLKGLSDDSADSGEGTVYSRTTTGFPYDLIRVPKSGRRFLPDGIIYGSFSRILSNMDGKKSLRRLIKEAEWEERKTFSSAKKNSYTSALKYLASAGYISVK